jgi:hypothetical protein
MDELAKLTEYCRQLGAPAGQAETMAGQILKRVTQLAAERNQSREETMAYLLRLVAQGRSGQIPREFQPPDTQSKS